MPFYIVWSHCVGVGFCQSLSILWKQCARVDLSEDLTHFPLFSCSFFDLGHLGFLALRANICWTWVLPLHLFTGGSVVSDRWTFFEHYFFPKMQNDEMNSEIPSQKNMEDGCMIKKWPAEHSRKLYPNPRFLRTAKAYFIYLISPKIWFLWFVPLSGLSPWQKPGWYYWAPNWRARVQQIIVCEFTLV